MRVMIDTETEKIRAMESELKTLESEDSKLTSTLQSSEEELLALRDVVTDLGKSVEEKEGQDSRRVRLREISASHAKVDETVSNLTGVKVIDATTRRATMNIQIKDKPHLYQLTLLFARDGYVTPNFLFGPLEGDTDIRQRSYSPSPEQTCTHVAIHYPASSTDLPCKERRKGTRFSQGTKKQKCFLILRPFRSPSVMNRSGIESVNLHPDVLRVDPADLRNRSLCAAVAEIINRLETVK